MYGLNRPLCYGTVLYLAVQYVVVVVVVFTLKIVLTSIQYPSHSLQGKETNFRGHKLTQNKVQKNNDKRKKDPEKVPTLATKI